MKNVYRAAFEAANAQIISIGSRASCAIRARRGVPTMRALGQRPEVWAEIRRLEAIQIWCARRGGSPG